MARQGAWPQAIVEGPFGFDNAISAEAARIKKIDSRIAGDVDLLIVPDLNSGNMLYKSFNYIGGGDCALAPGLGVAAGRDGWAGLALAGVATTVLGAVHAASAALVVGRARGVEVPFGPAMVGGALAVIVGGGPPG